VINYDMTATEFQRRYDEGDIICLLAQQIASESFGEGYKLSHKKPVNIVRYIHRAEEFIEKLKKHDLEIIHIRKDEQNEQE